MNLNYIAPINTLGYGIAGINILKELCKKNVNVALHSIGQMDCLPEEVSIVRGCLDNSVEYDYNAPALKLFHANSLKESVGRGPKIGFPIFELDTFNSYEKHQLKGLDKIFVTSQWAKQVIEANGIKVPTYVVNLGVDRTLFKDDMVLDNDIYKDSATKFLICGKWEVRKGHDVVIEAFCKAFTPQDNVRLIVNCFNPFIGKNGNQEWEKMYMLSEMSTKIHIFSERLPNQKNVAQLMASVDCGVFISRAEGWNLELLEMMSLGKHVITTNATAHTEFANKDNAMLVEVGESEEAFDGIFFKGGIGNWPSLTNKSTEQVVEYMREVHKKKQSGQLPLNIDGISTARTYSWWRSAEQVLENI